MGNQRGQGRKKRHYGLWIGLTCFFVVFLLGVLYLLGTLGSDAGQMVLALQNLNL